MLFFKSLRCDLNKIMFSPGFIISVLLTVVACMLAKLPQSNENSDPSVFEGIILALRGYKFDSPDYSSFAVFSFYDKSYWFPVLLPFLAGIPSVGLMCDEQNSKNIRLTLIRSSKNRYPLSKAISSGVGAVIAVCAGVILFGVLLRFVFPDISNFENVADSDIASTFERFGNAASASGRWEIMGIKIFNLALAAFCWGCFTFLVSLISTNKFLSLCFLIYVGYVCSKIHNGIILPILDKAESPKSFVFLLELVSPYRQISMYFTFKVRYEQPFILYVVYSLIVATVICLISVIIFRGRRELSESN